MPRTRLAVLFLATAALTPALAAAALLGPADGYNVFVLNNSTRTSSDTLGRYAVGNNASFSSFSVATNISYGNGLVVGGGLSITGGSVNGNTIVGGSATLNNPTFNGTLDITGNASHSNYGGFNQAVTIGGNLNSTSFSTSNSAPLRVGGDLTSGGSFTVNGPVNVKGNVNINNPTLGGGLKANGSVTLTGGGSANPGVNYGTTYSGPSYIAHTLAANSAIVPTPSPVPVDFLAAKNYLQGASTDYANATPNGTNSLSYGNRTITGASPTLNIFNLNASDFSGIYSFAINIPSGSTALINIAGTSVSLPNIGWTLNGSALNSQNSGADYGKVLFNLPQATTLTLNSLGGTILAPYADTTFNSGQLNGELITYNLTGTGESHDYAFTGNLPPPSGVPEPTALASILPAAALLKRRRS